MIYFLSVNYHSADLITRLINSIEPSKEVAHKTVIVNNSPQDSYIHLLKNESVFVLEAETNLGFGRACNLGLTWIYEQDPQAIVWLINPDAYLEKTSLEGIILFFNTYPELSIVGTIIYAQEDAQVWFAGGCFVAQTGAILEQDLLDDVDTAYASCDWVSGCSLILNLSNFHECPQFDPAYFLYYEDFDFCRRYASQGHIVAVTKQLSVIHQPSTITNRNIFRKIKCSTYSYLLTLERSANKFILLLRLTRTLAYAFLLIFIKPQVGFGKLYGVLLYWMRSLPHW